MKSREQWLVECSQIPPWVRAVIVFALWMAVLAVVSLEVELRATEDRGPGTEKPVSHPRPTAIER